MPILPRESDIYPDDLLESPPTGAIWWAAYTLSRREKVFMERLRKFHIAHYGPVIERTTRSPGGRVHTSFVPLFPGYVFVCGSEDQRLEAFKTRCAVRFMEVADKAELLFDLRQIKHLIESGAPLAPEARLMRGTRVRIRSGPLAGIEGEVERRRKDKLFVAVRFLQQGVSVALGDYETEKVE